MQVQVLGVVLTVSAPGLGHCCPLPRRHWPALHRAGGGCSSQLQTQATVLVLCTLYIYFSFKMLYLMCDVQMSGYIYCLSTWCLCVRYYLAMLG